MEDWITVRMGKDTYRRMLRGNLGKALEVSDWLIETAIKSGMTRQEAEAEFIISIIDGYEAGNKKINL